MDRLCEWTLASWRRLCDVAFGRCCGVMVVIRLLLRALIRRYANFSLGAFCLRHGVIFDQPESTQ